MQTAPGLDCSEDPTPYSSHAPPPLSFGPVLATIIFAAISGRPAPAAYAVLDSGAPGEPRYLRLDIALRGANHSLAAMVRRRTEPTLGSERPVGAESGACHEGSTLSGRRCISTLS
jgi:hypothetical protein